MKIFFLIRYILHLFTPRFAVQKQKSDWARFNGKVKSVRADFYTAIENKGKVLKEKRIDSKVDVFDLKGNMTESMFYDQHESLKEKCTYKYDKKGNLLMEKEFSPDGKLRSQTVYKYQFYNKRTRVRFNSIYDNIGKEVEISRTINIGVRKKYISDFPSKIRDFFSKKWWYTITHLYDDNGNLIAEKGGFVNDHYNDKIDIYSQYNDKGLKIQEEKHITERRGSPPLFKYSYWQQELYLSHFIFNDEGNIIERIDQSSIGKYMTVYKYEYDKNLNWIQRVEFYHVNQSSVIKVVERSIAYF